MATDCWQHSLFSIRLSHIDFITFSLDGLPKTITNELQLCTNLTHKYFLSPGSARVYLTQAKHQTWYVLRPLQCRNCSYIKIFPNVWLLPPEFTTLIILWSRGYFTYISGRQTRTCTAKLPRKDAEKRHKVKSSLGFVLATTKGS